MNSLLSQVPLLWASARAAASLPATVRPVAVVTRARRPVPAARSVPLARRIPKRGFNNIFAEPLTSVNVCLLNGFEDGAVVDAAALMEAGIIAKCPYGLKVLAGGELTKKLTVKAAAFSESAKEKIEQAGGKAEVV